MENVYFVYHYNDRGPNGSKGWVCGVCGNYELAMWNKSRLEKTGAKEVYVDTKLNKSRSKSMYQVSVFCGKPIVL